MAHRHVERTRKDAAGRITGLCNPHEAWEFASASAAIEDIEEGYHEYMSRPAGASAGELINVVTKDGVKYLRTRADGRTGNNLDRLPNCAGHQNG